MSGSSYDHFFEIFLHIRERLSLRNIFHTHAIVLGIAGRKVLLSHIGISFLFAKLALVQFAVIKAILAFGIATLFPLVNEVTLATQEIAPAYCGDGIVNGQETCDDANDQDDDGCDSSCTSENGVQPDQAEKVEINAPAIDIYPVLRDEVSSSLGRFQKACNSQRDDSSLLETLADTTMNDGSIDWLHVLSSYCIIDQYDTTRYGQLHSKTVTSKADALKMLAKTHALGEDVAFDEEGIYLGSLPYQDVYHDGRYIDYVIYLYEQGILEGIGNKNIKGEKSLDVLMPISKHEIKTLLKNLGVESSYPILDEPGSYIYRDEFAQIIIDAFPTKFADYAYMRGGNVAFYKKFLEQLEGKNPATQGVYLQLLSEKLHENDPQELISQQNLYVDGVTDFLKIVINKAIATTE